MRILIYSTLLINAVLSYSCSGHKEAPTPKAVENDYKTGNLKGAVAEYYTVTYSAVEKFGEAQKDTITDLDTVRFNDAGYWAENSGYSNNQLGQYIEKYKYTYKYDSIGRLLERNTQEIINTSPLSTVAKTIYKYDSSGNQIEAKGYHNNGAFKSKDVYKYDDKGHKVEWNGYAVPFDKRTAYEAQAELLTKRTYTTDKNGNILEEFAYDYDVSTRTLKTDPYWKEVFTYDANGNLIKKEGSKYPGDGIPINTNTYTYVYDSMGNWVTRKIFVNGRPFSITERTIKYKNM